mmetsp:Transcript_35488/g.94497  ORF Transcript_35488/g.94497 Transcript_35488/m.94497 type:complete len:279 (+) Transcript_35488:75-911(+)
MALCGLKAIVLVACALAAAGKVQLRHSSHKVSDEALHVGSFVTPLEFKHQLRVCNAFPNMGALEVYRGAERLTGELPMAYKACHDFAVPLKSGDKLEFRLGDASTGTFSVADLPNSDGVLLLVIHRHDSVSGAVSFESHVFAALESAQVAVIDTYKGKEHSVAKIMDLSLKKEGDKAEPVRSEELRYSSVVAVNPGEYEVVLDSDSGEERARTTLVALKRQSYVVMRTGVESMSGSSFPQELVVYPNFDPASLHSAAARPLASLAAVVLAAFGAVLAC